MTETAITTTKFKQGLTLVKIDLPHFHSLTNLLVIRAGSRYEDESTHGLAHFLEHMVFKGTRAWPSAREVAEAIEGVGGYFNAWTSYDTTAYWNVVPDRFYQRGIQMPLELAFWPLMRSEDLERERGVIIEEIRRIQDDPASYVGDLSQEITFAGHPLGRSVIGSEKIIDALTIEQFQQFRADHYHPSQGYFVTVGNLKDKNIDAEVEQLLDALKAHPQSHFEPFSGASRQALKVFKKPTDQTHFILSVADPKFALTNQERFVAITLNTVLGSGMSSRLFLNIREEKGLAYSISSSFTPYEDTGEISISGGVNTAKVELALAAVHEELQKLASEPVSPIELTKTKSLLTGAFDLASDRPLELASWYGTSRLLGMKETREQAKGMIEAVTAEQIQTLAKRVFAKDRQTLAVIGPYESDQIFRRFLQP